MGNKTVANIPEYKKKLVGELADLSNNKKTILMTSIDSIPASQYQEIVKKLRGKAIVKVPKKNLAIRAFKDTKNQDLEKLETSVKENSNFAILFSDLDAFELAGELLKNKTPAKAKPGQEAPEDIEIPAGPTDLVPGPAISELGALGIQIQIEKGKIHIKEPKVVAKQGEKISQGAADIMSKLDIKPFSIGFTPILAYDNDSKTLYLEIKINREEALNDLLYLYQKALPFAMNIGYVTGETARLMIGKAAGEERRLIKVITGEPEEPVAVQEDAKEEAPAKEDKKEEPKADAGAGLASLFG